MKDEWKSYLSGRVWGRGWGKMISSFFWGYIEWNEQEIYKFYKLIRAIIENDCNKWTNLQQRTTSTTNENFLIKTGILDEKDGRKGRECWERFGLKDGVNDIHIVADLSYKNVKKLSLDDSALWVTDEDIMARWE